MSGVFAAGVICLAFTGCGRVPATISAPAPSPTPDPHEQTLIEHTVNERLAQENRVTEQQLVNARAAASQRIVGRQMFLKLEGQYRERQAELSGNASASPSPSPKSNDDNKEASPFLKPAANPK